MGRVEHCEQSAKRSGDTFSASKRREWLQERKRGIGGSDAAAIIGLNPYMSNVELWEIKTGRKEQKDISEKEAVKFGVLAEDHIRQMFILDYPQFYVKHEDFKTYQNIEHPFIRGSFDGELTDTQTNRSGVLEIKTGTIRRAADWVKWGGRNFGEIRIPQNYYVQILHYFLVREDFEFAILKARLTELNFENSDFFNEKRIHIRHYPIERKNCLSDLDYLYQKEEEFWGYVERNERPPLILQGL